ncbi:hypothetical protein N1030_15795 [Desulfovibrio mangrovi]|uniref:hypothetical protein n=1 Tax=Desulfovibrio mangrovi TaxID=2976983 RepID=UPI002247D9B6|nr:hypothetical protein [Desulfovibrio mangrovi]UZP67053.1 hypothetical protein N1030_15795 [Desulfovibrio mangrovi]
MTTTICLLVRSPFDDPENGVEFARAALRMGLVPRFGAMDTLSLRDGKVVCDTYTIALTASGELDIAPTPQTAPLDTFDHVQVLSFGRRGAFLDKLQLLRLLAETTSMANSVDALMHLNSKYYMAGMGDVFRYPETYASSDADYLWSVVAASDERWIVKPPAEAFGRDVFLISRTDTNARAILQNMTGNGEGRYCLLQRYVPEIRQGEVRVLIAGGKVVGQYRRRSVQDHRTNLAQGASCEPYALSAEEAALCERLGPWLLERGVSFVGVDLVYPYVIEFNVLSPGGIRTIRELTGKDLSETVLGNILAK